MPITPPCLANAPPGGFLSRPGKTPSACRVFPAGGLDLRAVLPELDRRSGCARLPGGRPGSRRHQARPDRGVRPMRCAGGNLRARTDRGVLRREGSGSRRRASAGRGSGPGRRPGHAAGGTLGTLRSRTDRGRLPVLLRNATSPPLPTCLLRNIRAWPGPCPALPASARPVGAQKVTGQKQLPPAIKSDRRDFRYDGNWAAEARRFQGIANKARAHVRSVFA
jgi:hypothetical protein